MSKAGACEPSGGFGNTFGCALGVLGISGAFGKAFGCTPDDDDDAFAACRAFILSRSREIVFLWGAATGAGAGGASAATSPDDAAPDEDAPGALVLGNFTTIAGPIP